MERKIQRKHSNAFKAKVAFEASKGKLTVAQICSEYKVAASQVFAWKKQFVDGMIGIFENSTAKKHRSEDELTDPLLREIGRLQVENAFLKKKCLLSIEGFVCK